MMKKITKLTVTHTTGKYSVSLGKNILSNTHYLRSLFSGSQVLIVTDPNVAPQYLSTLTAALHDFQCDTLILPSGEDCKTFSTFKTIIDFLATHHHHRDTTLIALGGGAINDVTGFAAACYHRGVAWIAIPTTLLAQVDASIGGKTAINHFCGKNLMGAFYPPKTVIIDIDTLNSLPNREFCSGVSEIIKTALIKDADFFSWLEKNIVALLAHDTRTIHTAIFRACKIKRDIVMEDEKENHIRMHLNFGHTFAPAIEKTIGFGTWLHGEAVAFGIVSASFLSHQLNLLSESEYQRIRNMIIQHDLLKKIPDIFSADSLTIAMQNDKNVRANQLRFILLTSIGSAIIKDDISVEMIARAWKAPVN